jgi:hypothetical protein
MYFVSVALGDAEGASFGCERLQTGPNGLFVYMEGSLRAYLSVKCMVLPPLFNLPQLPQWSHVCAQPAAFGQRRSKTPYGSRELPQCANRQPRYRLEVALECHRERTVAVPTQANEIGETCETVAVDEAAAERMQQIRT